MVQGQSIQDAVDHFRKEEWCATLIDVPGTKTGMPMSRRDKSARTGGRVESQDELFRSSLNNEDGVPYMLFTYTEPAEGKEANKINETNETKDGAAGPRFSIMSTSLFLDLRKGVKGFNSFAHGGFLGAVIDEAMGTLIFTNYEYQRAQEDAALKKGGHWTPPPGVLDMNQGVRVLTASMNIRFRRPISTPSVVVATATLSRIDGRKIFLDVDVRDAKAHAKGEACATCDGMWMIVGKPPAKSRM